jgi:hypothetical protein
MSVGVTLLLYLCKKVSDLMCSQRVMAQAVSHRPHAMEARIESQASPCGISGGQKWH